MTLGEKLTSLREKRGWTKTFVAKKLGIKTLSTYANYEYGLREPDAETLGRIADIYEVSIDELLGRSIEGSQRIMGKEVDTSTLSENQRLVLDWAMAQDALSFHDMSKADLEDILENLSVIFEYEKNKRNAKKK